MIGTGGYLQDFLPTFVGFFSYFVHDFFTGSIFPITIVIALSVVGFALFTIRRYLF